MDKYFTKIKHIRQAKNKAEDVCYRNRETYDGLLISEPKLIISEVREGVANVNKMHPRCKDIDVGYSLCGDTQYLFIGELYTIQIYKVKSYEY